MFIKHLTKSVLARRGLYNFAKVSSSTQTG